MKRLKWTVIGLTIAALFYLSALLLQLDLFEAVLVWLHRAEALEIDELILPGLIFLVFALADLIRIQRAHALASEKMKIYKAMLQSTHHILNNFLNQMQIFRIEANRTPNFSPEVLALFKSITRECSSQIKALGQVTKIEEHSILASIAPRPSGSAGSEGGEPSQASDKGKHD